MIRSFLILISALLVCSCNLWESFSKGDKLAQVGSAVLYKSDIETIVPRGITGEDSIAIIRQYAESWAMKQLMLLQAEEQLPKSDKDVEKELEDYRMQLLIFRFENRFVEEKLDTLISDKEMEEYYDAHKESFRTKNGLVKARLVKIHNSSPNLQIVRKLAEQKDPENIEELEELAYNSAYKYSTYNHSWVDLQIVAREIGCDLQKLQEQLAVKDIIELKDSVYTSILQVGEYIKPEELSPFEYNPDKIKDIILTRRKQELLMNLQKDILNNALDNKKLKIIDDEKATD